MTSISSLVAEWTSLWTLENACSKLGPEALTLERSRSYSTNAGFVQLRPPKDQIVTFSPSIKSITKRSFITISLTLISSWGKLQLKERFASIEASEKLTRCSEPLALTKPLTKMSRGMKSTLPWKTRHQRTMRKIEVREWFMYWSSATLQSVILGYLRFTPAL